MPEDNSTKLFRKEALAHIASTEQLNHAISIIGRKSWILLAALSVLILFVFLWCLFGTINTRVEGSGIILSNKEGLYNAVAPKGDGQVIHLAVKLGDVVKKGQLVAQLENPYLDKQIHTSQQSIADLERRYKSLVNEANLAIKNRQQEILKQFKFLKNIESQQDANLRYIEDLLKTRQDAYKKGLITKQELVASWQQYYETKRTIEHNQHELSQNQINEKNYIEDWNQQIRQLELKIKDERQNLNSLQAQELSGKAVFSPIGGLVTTIQVQLGDMVKDGMPILSISPIQNEFEVIAYVPIAQGKKIKKDMKALVAPSIIKKEEFGSLIGKVTYVAPYPSTSESIRSTLKNADLVKHFIEKNISIEIHIDLEKDPTSYSGFKWTSAKGPQQEITAGTIVEVSVIVRKQAPVTLIIPAIKKLFGEV